MWQFDVRLHLHQLGVLMGFCSVVMFLNYCLYLNLKDVCLYCINVLRSVLWMFEDLRDWRQIYCKSRFWSNYLRQVHMGHILLCFLLLLSLLNLQKCSHKTYCIFALLGLAYRFVVSLLCFWVFQISICKGFSDSGSISLLILLINKRSAPFILLCCISCLNLDESFFIHLTVC